MSPKDFCEEEVQRIACVKSYFLNNLSEQFTVRQLARKAALGEQRFSEAFYKIYGINAGAYMHASRMKLAQFLIGHTERSLKEIAGLCGYSDYKSFLKAYKKYFGISAGKERKH